MFANLRLCCKKRAFAHISANRILLSTHISGCLFLGSAHTKCSVSHSFSMSLLHLCSETSSCLQAASTRIVLQLLVTSRSDLHKSPITWWCWLGWHRCCIVLLGLESPHNTKPLRCLAAFTFLSGQTQGKLMQVFWVLVFPKLRSEGKPKIKLYYIQH